MSYFPDSGHAHGQLPLATRPGGADPMVVIAATSAVDWRWPGSVNGHWFDSQTVSDVVPARTLAASATSNRASRLLFNFRGER